MDKLTPVLGSASSIKTQQSSRSDIARFVKAAGTLNTAQSGRLIFAMDATLSRQPTWDRAISIQSRMFDAVAKLSGLSVQLVYFRGYGECRASKWVMNSASLSKLMTGIKCLGGQTQLGKVLVHAASENGKEKIAAVAFVGDAMEENIDTICHQAGQLALKGVKVFMFLEGRDPIAEQAFKEVTKLTNGAFMRLGTGSADDLAELPSAVAIYATGGYAALEKQGGHKGVKMLEQMKKLIKMTPRSKAGHFLAVQKTIPVLN